MTRRTVDVILRAREGDFVRGMKNAKRAVSDLREDIDTTNDRTAWLAQSALALGPALTTVGAVAVPALAAMATQATVLAGAVGAGALAFSGVGDALKALNDYQAEPSAANMAALREEFEKMGPAGAEFIQFLDEIGPQLKELQFAAREGMFPGMEDGIDHLLTLLPQVQRIVSEISEGLGQLASEAGSNLAGPGFADFFQFLETDAKRILVDLGRTIGNFAGGLAHLMEAFAPTTRDFSAGLLDMSRSFEQWAANVGDSEGFREFIDYVREATPKVLELVAAFADAAVEILEAAAPIGDVVVPALSDLLRIIAQVADTPIGTLMLGLAAAMSAYGRAAALASITTGGLSGKLLGLESGFGKANRAVLTGAKTMDEYNRAKGRFISSAGKAGAAAGILAMQMTGVTEQVGLNNAAMGVMVGSMAGPWGAAIGGGIGLVMDFAAANDDLEASVKRANAAMKAGDLSAMSAELRTLNDQISATSEKMDMDWSLNPIKHVSEGWQFALSTINELATGSAQVAEQQRVELEDQFNAMSLGITAVGQGLGYLKSGHIATLDELTTVLNRAAPAMSALGWTAEDLAAAMDDGSIVHMADAIVRWTKNADSSRGRTRAFSQAINGLDDDMLSTADSASALKAALDALLSPQMNLSAATDAWTTALRHLNNDLAKNNKTLAGNSDAAIQNRAAIRDRVTAMMELLGAEADAGASAKKLRSSLLEQREALINAGKAAGVSAGEMRAYLKELGLTPDIVKTLVQVKNDQALAAIRRVISEMAQIKDKSARITYYVNQVNGNNKHSQGGADGDPNTPMASGGFVSGPGTGTSDSIPARLSNGEFVIKASSVRKYGTGVFEALNEGRFADGGPVGKRPPGSDIRWGAFDIDGLLGGLKDVSGKMAGFLVQLRRHLASEIRAAEKEAERDKEMLDAIREQRRALVDAVKANYQDSPFAGGPQGFSRTVELPDNYDEMSSEDQQAAREQQQREQAFWDSFFADFNARGQRNYEQNTLTSDIADASDEIDLIRTLKRKGFDGEALADLLSNGDIDTIRAYASMSRSDLADYKRLYERRDRLASRVGNAAGNAVYGEAVKAQLAEVRESNKHLHELNKRMARVENVLDKIPEKTGQAVGSAINGAAGKATRKK